MSERDVAVEAVLPNDINTFEYTRNCHFIRFVRKGGQSLKLLPNGQMLYRCDACEFYCYSDSNHGTMPCPKCHNHKEDTGGKITGVLVKPQTVMVPEEETDFEWPEDYPSPTAEDNADDDGEWDEDDGEDDFDDDFDDVGVEEDTDSDEEAEEKEDAPT